VNDIEAEVRELLWKGSRDLPPHLEVPETLTKRVRRRIALNALAVGTTVAVAAAGAFVSLRAIGTVPVPRPNQPGTTSAACAPAQLGATGSMEGAAGSRDGAIVLTNASAEPCTLEGTPTIELLDPSGAPIGTGVTFEQAPAEWEITREPEPAGWPVVTLDPGAAASVRVRWSNWCPDGRVAPSWRVGIPGGGAAVPVDGLEDVIPPPCNGLDMPSTIEVGPFEPVPD
jgi:hypothetical protein